MDDFIAKYLPLLISGHYSDWFFKVVVAQLINFTLNNFALLWIVYSVLKKVSSLTKNTWDDKLADKFGAFLSKFKNPIKKEVKE